jgi:hypothetical protein
VEQVENWGVLTVPHYAIKRHSLRSLERLGYHVSLQEVNQADEEVVFQA